MKILIIEDEEPAALRLKKILNELEPDALILDVIAVSYTHLTLPTSDLV